MRIPVETATAGSADRRRLGLGGCFEKRGLHLGHLPPQLGITLRTATALTVRTIIGMVLTVGGIVLLSC